MMPVNRLFPAEQLSEIGPSTSIWPKNACL